MSQTNKWIEFLTPIMKKGGFVVSESSFKGETESIIYRSLDQNSDLEIRIGYLNENLLIYLTVYDPRIPGYNKYVEGDYFNQYDFLDSKSYGKPGLEFKQENQEAITDLLTYGLEGKEIQFVENGEIVKSKVNLIDEEFYVPIHFKKRSFWQKIFGNGVESKVGIEKREIDLNNIFGGFKDVV